MRQIIRVVLNGRDVTHFFFLVVEKRKKKRATAAAAAKSDVDGVTTRRPLSLVTFSLTRSQLRCNNISVTRRKVFRENL